MDRLTLEEFKEKSNIEIIKGLMKINNGYITSKELDNFGIHRMYLNIMNKNGLIKKVGSGIYIDSNKKEDNYYIFSLSMPNAIYSHMTALYLQGMSIRISDDRYYLTVRKNYNSKHLKNHEVFYVADNIYKLGITEVLTPMGNKVKCYDIERCICDIIRSRKRMNLEYIKYSVKEYLKRKDKDLIKLSSYAEAMNIKEEVMNFVSMLYE